MIHITQAQGQEIARVLHGRLQTSEEQLYQCGLDNNSLGASICACNIQVLEDGAKALADLFGKSPDFNPTIFLNTFRTGLPAPAIDRPDPDPRQELDVEENRRLRGIGQYYDEVFP